MDQNLINRVFNLLIENKKFPNYQAERRIDIFINYFLVKILCEFLNENVEYVCPEFPIKKKDSNLSTKLDYLCKTNNEIVFVELKTDVSSLKSDQAKIYLNSNWSTCKSELKEIINSVKNTVHLEKYKTLSSTIDKINITDKNPSLRVIYISPFPNPNSSFAKDIKVINSKKLIDFSKPILPEDQVLWSLLCKLDFDLYVFEISK